MAAIDEGLSGGIPSSRKLKKKKAENRFPWSNRYWDQEDYPI